MRILYSGGGTLGSVSPLIAIHNRLTTYNLKPNTYKALWLGTKHGPEKDVVSQEDIPFKSIIAGKLRRYFDLRNIIDFFKIKLGFWQTFFIIRKFKPDVILSAGSFVSVPVVWAGWLLGVSCIIHQQDVQPGLANKLMAPFAAQITVALEVSLKDYPKGKTMLVGNPVRKSGITWLLAEASRRGRWGDQRSAISNTNFQFPNDLPVLLVVGGGTGALAINKLIWNSLDELTKFCNIIHLTGKNKTQSTKVLNYQSTNYKTFEFLDNEMYDVIQSADVVVSRAGMSALTELAYFKKSCIIIPLPNSHQIKNAEYFASQNACIYLNQKDLTKEKLISNIKNLIEDKDEKNKLGENINKIFVDYSGEKIIEEIKNILLKNTRGLKPAKPSPKGG